MPRNFKSKKTTWNKRFKQVNAKRPFGDQSNLEFRMRESKLDPSSIRLEGVSSRYVRFSRKEERFLDMGFRITESKLNLSSIHNANRQLLKY